MRIMKNGGQSSLPKTMGFQEGELLLRQVQKTYAIKILATMKRYANYTQ